jgi:hypothetical protein
MFQQHRYKICNDFNIKKCVACWGNNINKCIIERSIDDILYEPEKIKIRLLDIIVNFNYYPWNIYENYVIQQLPQKYKDLYNKLLILK